MIDHTTDHESTEIHYLELGKEPPSTTIPLVSFLIPFVHHVEIESMYTERWYRWTAAWRTKPKPDRVCHLNANEQQTLEMRSSFGSTLPSWYSMNVTRNKTGIEENRSIMRRTAYSIMADRSDRRGHLRVESWSDAREPETSRSLFEVYREQKNSIPWTRIQLRASCSGYSDSARGGGVAYSRITRKTVVFRLLESNTNTSD